MNSKAQIVATIGPSSVDPDVFLSMLEHDMAVARLNFSWGGLDEKKSQIEMIRKIAKKFGKHVPIICDLPGPRVQEKYSHTYDREAISAITDQDKEYIKFAVEQGIEYIAVSFVGSEKDIKLCREVIKSFGGSQPIIAKIERRRAVENLDKIIAAADAVMIARGDLGNEVPLEQIPFIQDRIIKKPKWQVSRSSPPPRCFCR